MRILFVTREYPPFEVGGVAKHAFFLVKHLRELGVSCKVLSFGDSNSSCEDVVFVDPYSSILSKSNCPFAMDVKIPADIVRLTRVANNLITKERFDIVHVEEPYVGSFVRHGRKVTTIHDTSYGEIKSILCDLGRSSNLKRAMFYASLGPYLELMCIASSRAVIVPFSHIKRELLRVYRIPEEKVRVIFNGVEFPQSPISMDKVEARKRLGLPPEKLLIFTAARHITRKRLDILVEAVRSLRKEGMDGYRVIIAGDGPLRPYLTDLLERYGLKHLIELPGWVSQEQLSLYYQATDIFVLTSEYESGPISLLEAMSFGAAAVSSRIDGFPRLVRDGVDGLLFPVGDYRALSRCIRRLLDDTLRLKMSISARLFAKKFDWKIVAKETKNLYWSLL